MFSAFFGVSPIDEQIERATSENLPTGQEDIALNLEICDQIRCKQFGAKEVSASLRKRLRHTNPNVQLLTLLLIDVCVKNGGNHFLVEVASREFMDDIVSFLKQPTGTNQQVQNKLLELIQNWAETFKSRSELIYTVQVYGALRAQGYKFPPKESINAAMIDTKTAPEWTDNDVCMRCRTAFTFTNRKHHCRNCGQIFCQPCSTNKESLPHYGIPEPVRVCTGCYLKLRNVSVVPSSLSLSEFMASEAPKKVAPELTGLRLISSATAESSDMDEDLKKAIELSLQETKNSVSAKRVTFSQPPVTSTATQDPEEDPDLAAAIAASLQDLNVQDPHSSLYPDPTDYHFSNERTESQAYESYQTEAPDFNLTERETQNILLFSKLIDSLKESSHPVPDASIQNLYADLGKLVPKLSYNLQDTIRKHQSFLDIQTKLASTIKLYDSLLDQSSSIPVRSNMRGPAYESSYSTPTQSHYPKSASTGYETAHPHVPAYSQPGMTHAYYSQPETSPYAYPSPKQPENSHPYPPYGHLPPSETSHPYPPYAQPPPEVGHPYPTKSEFPPPAQSHTGYQPPTYPQSGPTNYEQGVPNAPSYLNHVPSPAPPEVRHPSQYPPAPHSLPQAHPQGHPDPRYITTHSHFAPSTPQAPSNTWSQHQAQPGSSQYHMYPPHYSGPPNPQAPPAAPVPEAPLIDL